MAADGIESVDEDPQEASDERKREGGRTNKIGWPKLGLKKEESNHPKSEV